MALLIQCIVLCAVFSLLILPPLFKTPLSQIMSYPPAIRARVESLPQYNKILHTTKQRNMMRKIVGALIAVVLLAVLAYCSGKTSFFPAFIHVFVLFFVVNMYDLIILDFIIFRNSTKVVIPGTEDMVKEYRNLTHHIKAAFKGTAIGIIAATLAASIVEVIAILNG